MTFFFRKGVTTHRMGLQEVHRGPDDDLYSRIRRIRVVNVSSVFEVFSISGWGGSGFFAQRRLTARLADRNMTCETGSILLYSARSQVWGDIIALKLIVDVVWRDEGRAE